MGFPNSADCGLGKYLAVLCDNAYEYPTPPAVAVGDDSVLGKIFSLDHLSLGTTNIVTRPGPLVALYQGVQFAYSCRFPDFITAIFDKDDVKTLVIAFAGVEPPGNDRPGQLAAQLKGIKQTISIAVQLATEMTPDGKSMAINQDWFDQLWNIGWTPGDATVPPLIANLGLAAVGYEHIILAGHSWGGCFALMLARYLQSFPELAAKIRAVHTFGMPRFNGANLMNCTSTLSQKHWIAAGDFTPAIPPSGEWPVRADQWPQFGYGAHPLFCGVNVVARRNQSWDKFGVFPSDTYQLSANGLLGRPDVPFLPSDPNVGQCERIADFVRYSKTMSQNHLPLDYAWQIERAEAHLITVAAHIAIPTATQQETQTLAEQYLDHESIGDLQTWLAGLSYDQAEVRAWENGIVATQPSGPPSAPGTRGTGTGDRVQTNPVPYRRHRHRNAVTTH